MKVASLGFPHAGGTHAVFAALRKGLAADGVNMRWVDSRPYAEPGLDRAIWELERNNGDDVSADSNDDAQKPDAIVRHLLHAKFDAVLINVFVAPRLMNIVRYLPPALPRIMIVHSISHATYQAARALRDYVHVTVGVSSRIRDDLISRYGFSPLRTHAIFNGIDPASVAKPSLPRPHNAVLSLGRLEDSSKGILQLPQILDRGIAELATLTIAGDGPDRRRLEAKCAAARLHPHWLGMVPPNGLAEVYGRHAIFLFPSRFEGMGLALAEAMASGLVPLAARIRGVTDTIIEDGTSGFLFDQRDARTARAHLLQLLQDPERVERMRQAASVRARRLFALDGMANAYRSVLQSAIECHVEVRCLPIARWSIPYRMRPGLRSLLPRPVRRRIGDIVLSLR